MLFINFGFKQSAFVRLTATVIFFVFSAISIIVVNNTSLNSSNSDPSTSTEIDAPFLAGSQVFLKVESTFPIESCEVVFDQYELELLDGDGENDSAFRWVLKNVRPDSELFISIQSGNFFSEKSEAVRVVIETPQADHEATLWGQGDLTRTDTIADWFPNL